MADGVDALRGVRDCVGLRRLLFRKCRSSGHWVPALNLRIRALLVYSIHIVRTLFARIPTTEKVAHKKGPWKDLTLSSGLTVTASSGSSEE